MTSRELRKQRRAAERKARKLQRKQHDPGAMAARTDEPALFSEAKTQQDTERKARKLEYQQSRIAATATVAAPERALAGSAALPPNPALLDEFTMEEQTEMMALRARIHARAGLSAPARLTAEPRLDEPAIPGEAKTQDEPAILSEAKTQQRSGPTGPRTAHGKAVSSGNSLKHGLASGRIIIPGEDPAGFEALLTDLTAEHAPAIETEALLVQQMAQSWWLMQRAIRLQNQAFTETSMDVPKLVLFMRYQTTHERAFYKALNTLIRVRAERRKSDPVGAMDASPVSQIRRSPRPGKEFVSQNAAVQAAIPASGELKSDSAPPFRRGAA